MTKTTFGKIKLRQPFSTIYFANKPTVAYPNGVTQHFIKRTNKDAWDNVHNLYGFKSNDTVFTK